MVLKRLNKLQNIKTIGFLFYSDAIKTHGTNASRSRITDRIAKASARNGCKNQLHRKGQHGAGANRVSDRRTDTFGGHRPNIPQT